MNQEPLLRKLDSKGAIGIVEKGGEHRGVVSTFFLLSSKKKKRSHTKSPAKMEMYYPYCSPLLPCVCVMVQNVMRIVVVGLTFKQDLYDSSEILPQVERTKYK